MRKLIFSTLFIILSFCLFGCNKEMLSLMGFDMKGVKYIGQIAVRENIDEFDKTKISYCTVGNYLKDYKNNLLGFDLYRIKSNFFIMAGYSGKDWMFIRKGESLELLIDGTEHLFLESKEGSRDSRNVHTGSVSEIATYPITIDLVKRIVESKTTKIRIIGDQTDVTADFNPVNYNYFKTFYENYMVKEPTPHNEK